MQNIDMLPTWIDLLRRVYSNNTVIATFGAHDLLLSRMQNIDMPPTWIDLLWRVYSNNMVIANFGQTSTEPVSVRRGLGFALRFQYAKSPQVWTLPGLVFADDLVLLAENTNQLQNLMDISAHHLESLKLTFNAKKIGGATFFRTSGRTLPNGQPIPCSTEYRYLEVTLCDRECYDVHEAKMRQSSQRAIGTLRKCCLWGFDQYVIVCELWKAVSIKSEYLEEAVLSLDKENVVTKEHVQVILTQLCQKVEMFLTGAPAHDKGRMAKRLLMVTQSCLAG
ncbi:hypothetical protein MRX96_037106 [Rhipicephalus microplus]